MDLLTILIVLIVVGSRLLVPLLIPKYPLPAVIACLIIDAVDQTIFQTFTDLELTGYQSYDKALDIYYLSIAYLSTFRNWTNQIAFQISQFLFYYRMFGLSLFEATQNRAILFIFQIRLSTFSFFISAVALLWKMERLNKKMLLYSAAFIWIFIKLPQEYWIHIAQLDTTDFIKETILGVPTSSTWSYAISQNMWIFPVLGIIAAVIAVLIYKVIKMLSKPDYKLQVSPVLKEKIALAKPSNSFLTDLRQGQNHFIEKIIFSGLLVFIFTNIFPGLDTTFVRVLIGVAVIVILNALVSHMLIKSTRFKIDIFNSFLAMFVINVFSLIFYITVIASIDGINLIEVLFFAYIITLITVLHDRFKPYYLARFGKKMRINL
jgi:hypothetical protein